MSKSRLFLSEYMPELITAQVPQFELLNSGRFENFIEARDVSIHKQDLEHYEQIGFLYPVLRLKRPKIEESGLSHYAGIGESAWEFSRYMEKGMLEFPTAKNFRPWKEYRDGYEENTVIYYHPYQVFMVDRFLNLSRFTITSNFLETATPTDFENTFEKMKKFHQQFKESFLKTRPQIVNQIGLLLRLQNAYQPEYRGRLQLSFDFERSYRRWIDWRKNEFSPESVLKAGGFSVDEVKNLRDYFAAQAHFIDPVGNWYPLIRLLTSDKKERLKGNALLAQDYYEIVGILNLFLQEITKEEQPEPDDIIDGLGGKWKEEYYGKKFNYADPDIRKKIVSDFLEVVLPKVVLLVEGDSEETAIRILFGAFIVPIENAGISIHNFEGTGGISLFNVGAVLHVARSQGIGSYLIIDNDEDANRLVTDLCRSKLLSEDCYRIWKKDFEEDNFGAEAVLETVNQRLLASTQTGIEKEEMRQEMERHPQKKLWKCLHDICWSKCAVELDKIISKKELTRMLSVKRADEIRIEIKNNKYEPKWQIEKEIFKIYKKFCK